MAEADELSEDATAVLALLAGASAPLQPARVIAGPPPRDARTRAHRAWTKRILHFGLHIELDLQTAGLIADTGMEGYPNPEGYGWGYVITDAGRAALADGRRRP